MNIRGLGVPLFSFLLLLIGALLVVAAAVFWLLPDGPVGPRLPLSVFGPLLLVAGWLSWKYYEPAEKRSVRLAVSIYLFFAISIIASGIVQRFAPDPDAGVTVTAAALAEARKKAEDKKAEDKTRIEDKDRKQTKEERAAERQAEREKQLAEGKADREKELRIFTSGGYWETVKWSGGRFLEKAASDFGFAIILIGMFLLGAWFVRSGVMENTGAHLPLFRKLAVFGLPIGIGLGLLGSLIAMSHTPGDRYDGWGIAVGLSILGNLPACLGYVGMVVLMLHSDTVFSRIRVLGPLGRMALDQLPHPVTDLRHLLLRICHGPLGHAACAASGVRAGGLRGADCLQPLVAVQVSLRPDGMALARLHLRARAAIRRRSPPRSLFRGLAPRTPSGSLLPFSLTWRRSNTIAPRVRT